MRRGLPEAALAELVATAWALALASAPDKATGLAAHTEASAVRTERNFMMEVLAAAGSKGSDGREAAFRLELLIWTTSWNDSRGSKKRCGEARRASLAVKKKLVA